MSNGFVLVWFGLFFYRWKNINFCITIKETKKIPPIVLSSFESNGHWGFGEEGVGKLLCVAIRNKNLFSLRNPMKSKQLFIVNNCGKRDFCFCFIPRQTMFFSVVSICDYWFVAFLVFAFCSLWFNFIHLIFRKVTKLPSIKITSINKTISKQLAINISHWKPPNPRQPLVMNYLTAIKAHHTQLRPLWEVRKLDHIVFAHSHTLFSSVARNL